MLLEDLRQEVLLSDLELMSAGLVPFTFCNDSGIERQRGLFVIKRSGVPLEMLHASDGVTDLDRNAAEGKLKPSSELKIHLVLYKEFQGFGRVMHTDSTFATLWTQSGRSIPAFNTTRADYLHGPVPTTAPLSDEEVQGDYVLNTGFAIGGQFNGRDPTLQRRRATHIAPSLLGRYRQGCRSYRSGA